MDMKCILCSELLTDDKDIRMSPWICNHVYHKICIQNFIIYNNMNSFSYPYCPICQINDRYITDQINYINNQLHQLEDNKYAIDIDCCSNASQKKFDSNRLTISTSDDYSSETLTSRGSSVYNELYPIKHNKKHKKKNHINTNSSELFDNQGSFNQLYCFVCFVITIAALSSTLTVSLIYVFGSV